jgi:hypothetical protein
MNSTDSGQCRLRFCEHGEAYLSSIKEVNKYHLHKEDTVELISIFLRFGINEH